MSRSARWVLFQSIHASAAAAPASALIRQLLRYYGSVRLPASVHHRLSPSRVHDSGRASRYPAGTRVLPASVQSASRHALVLRPRGDLRALASLRARRCCLPRAIRTSAPRRLSWFRGSIARPASSPVNASRPPLRASSHDSGPASLATLLLDDSFIHCRLPAFAGAINGAH